MNLKEIIDNMDINTFIHSYIIGQTRNTRNFKENRIILHTNRIKTITKRLLINKEIIAL